MTTRQPRQGPDKRMIRSSAAEYLTFVASSGQGGVEAIYADENIWLSQKMLAQLYDVETHTINYHLKKVFADSELEEGSVIRKFRITATDGKHYHTNHYNLAAIIAVGYKVNSERAVQFESEPRAGRAVFRRTVGAALDGRMSRCRCVPADAAHASIGNICCAAAWAGLY